MAHTTAIMLQYAKSCRKYKSILVKGYDILFVCLSFQKYFRYVGGYFPSHLSCTCSKRYFCEEFGLFNLHFFGRCNSSFFFHMYMITLTIIELLKNAKNGKFYYHKYVFITFNSDILIYNFS